MHEHKNRGITQRPGIVSEVMIRWNNWQGDQIENLILFYLLVFLSSMSKCGDNRQCHSLLLEPAGSTQTQRPQEWITALHITLSVVAHTRAQISTPENSSEHEEG